MPVIDNNNIVVGIVTAIDVLKAIQKGKMLNKLKAKDIMTPNPSAVEKWKMILFMCGCSQRKSFALIGNLITK